MKRINRTLQLVPEDKRDQAGLISIESLVVKPSKDLRDVTRAHVHEIPRSVQILLRTLGGWGRDWRMASYLLATQAIPVRIRAVSPPEPESLAASPHTSTTT